MTQNRTELYLDYDEDEEKVEIVESEWELYVMVCCKLNVRAGADTDYAKVGSVPRGAELHVVEEKDGWFYGNDYAWVCAKYLGVTLKTEFM